jgi:hypothetical protein
MIKYMTFQKIILIIAIILLLLFLGIIGKELYLSSNSDWSPIVSECPDYWNITTDASGSLVCDNTHNLGTCSTTTMDFTTDYYSGADGTCNKYTWATGCGLQWDGITSGISNPCDSS